jgi:hypothetical protein
MVARARQPRGALCRISACEQLNLFGHALFFLEARIVAGDALCEHEIPISRLEHVQRHFLSRVLKERASGILAVIGCIESSHDVPLAQGRFVGKVRRQRRRGSYQIPADEGERGDVAGCHGLRFYSARRRRSITFIPTHSSRAWVSHTSV